MIKNLLSINIPLQNLPDDSMVFQYKFMIYAGAFHCLFIMREIYFLHDSE